MTSVITTCRPFTRRTTIRPLVLATSGSSTPASWVLVPVDPLATPSDVLSRAAEALGIAPPTLSSSGMPGHIRPPQPQAPTWSREWSTYQRSRESQSSNGRNPVAALAGAGPRSPGSNAAVTLNAAASAVPPIATLRPVFMVLGRTRGPVGSPGSGWDKMGDPDPRSPHRA